MKRLFTTLLLLPLAFSVMGQTDPRTENPSAVSVITGAAVPFGNAALPPGSGAVAGLKSIGLGTADLHPLRMELNGGISDIPRASTGLGRLHKIVGYTTLVLGLATALTAPEVNNGTVVEGSLNLHKSLGIAMASMSGLSMGLGIASQASGGYSLFGSPMETLHALLGAVGGTMMIITPFLAPSETHQLLGEAGFTLMGLAVLMRFTY